MGKAGINFRKHGVRLPEAIPVFDDPFAITVTDDESDPSGDLLPSAWAMRTACWPSCTPGAMRT